MVSSVWPEPGFNTSVDDMVGDGSTVSVAFALPRADTVVLAGASSVTLGGRVRDGGVVSLTIMV